MANDVRARASLKDDLSGPLTRVGDVWNRQSKNFATGALAAKGAEMAFSMVGSAISGVGDVVVGAVTKAAAFEKAMLNVQTIAKVSGDELNKTSDDVLDLSVQFGQSAQTMAGGLYDISSSGFAGRDGLTVLTAAAKAGTAGLATTAEAASGLTAVLNAYGLKATDAGRVSDVLFKIVERGVITFPELSAEIGKTAALAAPLGVSLEEVGAALAVLTKHGIDAENATTQINAVMTSILQPSQQAAKLAEKLGIQWSVAGLKGKGLVGIMQELIEKTGGSQEEMAVLLGDARAIRGAFVLAAQGGAELTAELKEMQGAVGATDAAFGTQSKGLSFKLDQLNARWDAFSIRVGTKVIPALVELVGMIDKVLVGTEQLAEGNLLGDKMTDAEHLNALSGSLELFATNAARVGPTLDAVTAAGIATRASADDLSGTIAGLGATLGETKGPATDINRILDKMGLEAGDAAKAIDTLADTITDELFGDAINAGNLAQLKDTHRELIKQRDAAKEGSREYTILTGKIAENEQAMFELQLQMAQEAGPAALTAFLDRAYAKYGTNNVRILAMITNMRTLFGVLAKAADLGVITLGQYTGKTIPVYHGGEDYVPTTGPAVLQQGEAVLDRQEAAAYRSGSGGRSSGGASSGQPVVINVVLDGGVLARVMDRRLRYASPRSVALPD